MSQDALAEARAVLAIAPARLPDPPSGPPGSAPNIARSWLAGFPTANSITATAHLCPLMALAENGNQLATEVMHWLAVNRNELWMIDRLTYGARVELIRWGKLHRITPTTEDP